MITSRTYSEFPLSHDTSLENYFSFLWRVCATYFEVSIHPCRQPLHELARNNCILSHGNLFSGPERHFTVEFSCPTGRVLLWRITSACWRGQQGEGRSVDPALSIAFSRDGAGGLSPTYRRFSFVTPNLLSSAAFAQQTTTATMVRQVSLADNLG